MRRLVLVFLVVLPFFVQSQEVQKPSHWDSLKFFVGRWQGATDGEPGKGTGERNYEFLLDDQFLQLKNRTIYPPQEKNPKGEIHEDIAYYSYDKNQKRFVLRQFHKEGFVNEYVQQEGTDGKTLVFLTNRIENIPDGWRARETYKIVSQDEYREVFELAEPNKEFALYSQSEWGALSEKART
jgi:hypothetical protein